MPEQVFETTNAAETEALGADLAQRLSVGDVVLVSGELGSGKTTFVRGACRALGVTGPVTSPTFTIGSRYSGRLPVSHVDLYRLEGFSGEDPALLADYLDRDTVGFVEWPERAAGDAAPDGVVMSVRIEHLGGDLRRVVLR